MSTGRRGLVEWFADAEGLEPGHDFKEVAANNGDVPVKAGGKK
ncbi:hypothetical protein SAMN02990966_05950 [Rhodospirillales bacterium URHD0017]|nr:hypothetical protein SAMN02990966_05950 [Rhodospirillales bacterium URHD0017]